MPNTRHWAALALCAATASARSAPDDVLTVRYVHPENFFDAMIATPQGPDQDHAEFQRLFTAHLASLAAKRLKPGEQLDIRVLDVDLAGDVIPQLSSPGTDFRILRDSRWPRVSVHYTLRRGDQVVAEADEVISDMSYLERPNRYLSGDPLRYEKAMVDRWFDRLVAPQR